MIWIVDSSFCTCFNRNNQKNENVKNRAIFFKATGFKNREEEDSYDVDGTSLFRVRGTCPEDVMTTQIQPECVSVALCKMRIIHQKTMHMSITFILLFLGFVSLHR